MNHINLAKKILETKRIAKEIMDNNPGMTQVEAFNLAGKILEEKK